MNALFSITSLLMVSGIALAYKSGAPVGVCDSMIPEHGVDPKDTPSPYTISVDKTNIKPGGSVTLKITGTKGHKFKGFFVQARNSTNHIVNGTFGKVAGAKVIDCPPGNKVRCLNKFMCIRTYMSEIICKRSKCIICGEKIIFPEVFHLGERKSDTIFFCPIINKIFFIKYLYILVYYSPFCIASKFSSSLLYKTEKLVSLILFINMRLCF